MAVCSCPEAIKHTRIFEELEACKANLATIQSHRLCGIARYRDDLLRETEVENCDREEEELDDLIWKYGSYLANNCSEYIQFLLG